jgi:ABC-2 type transport system permease protein
MFAVVAAITAQLAQDSRTASGIALGVLAVAYLLRGIGDTARAATATASLSWASPIGWTQQVRPFGPVHWWVFAIPVVFAVAGTAAAVALAGRRDIGAGLLPARPGPAGAGPWLRGPCTLAWRLQRGPLLAWTAGFLVYGAALGGIADGVGALVGQGRTARDLFAELGGHSGLINAFLAATMGIMGLIASAYAVQAVARMRAEELGQRADPVLAAAVGRSWWAFSHLVFALAGPAVLLAATGVAAGLTHGARTGDIAGQLPRVLGAALVQLPAAWVLAGLTLALVGILPRLAAVSWAAIVASVLLGELGPVLGLTQWAMDISPFAHLPKLPGAAFTVLPLAWLTVVAAALACVGLIGLRRRDIG